MKNRFKEYIMDNIGNRKVKVFAAYQIGVGSNAKMIGDESKNIFDVSFGLMSEMICEVERILYERHMKELEVGPVLIVVHHCQLISSL